MYKAIENYYIQDETITSIGQFAVLWGMVEEKFFDKCCTSPKLARMIVLNVSEEMILLADSIKKSLLAHYNSVENREMEEFLCLRGKDKSFSEKVRLFLGENEIDSESKVFSAVCVCFRIRNNLFHGEKIFWLLNAQKDILDSCAAFMDALLSNKAALQIQDK
jgi:hypothetical protein